MLRNSRKKGVTLIELVIALGIMAIVTSLIFFFYFSNEKQLNHVEVKSDLQYEAKSFTESVSRFAMEATDAKWKDGESLSFNLINDRKDKSKKRVVYTLDREKKVIILKEKEFSKEEELEIGEWSDPKVICEDVKEIQADVTDSSKVKITLILERKGIEYKVEESYVFRNSHLK